MVRINGMEFTTVADAAEYMLQGVGRTITEKQRQAICDADNMVRNATMGTGSDGGGLRSRQVIAAILVATEDRE